jgi:hypothetical protein
MRKTLTTTLGRLLTPILRYGSRRREMTYVWDGIVNTDRLKAPDQMIEARTDLLTSAKSGDWGVILASLTEKGQSYEKSAISITEPNDLSLNTLLHYAALTNAPLNVVDRLLRAGASCMRRNAQGQRAVDIAHEQGHGQLVERLEPKLAHMIPAETIQQIEQNFHKLINYPPNDPYQLPQIDLLLEDGYQAIYFPIIGSYGGHRHWFDHKAPEDTLMVFRECRIAAGSEILHKITTRGVEMLARGNDVFKYKLK